MVHLSLSFGALEILLACLHYKSIRCFSPRFYGQSACVDRCFLHFENFCTAAKQGVNFYLRFGRFSWAIGSVSFRFRFYNEFPNSVTYPYCLLRPDNFWFSGGRPQIRHFLSSWVFSNLDTWSCFLSRGIKIIRWSQAGIMKVNNVSVYFL